MIPHYLDIRNCDNMELMAQYATGYFDLAIVDPPYGINATKMGSGAPSRGGTISTAKAIKGRLNSGGGKLKNRLLNKSAIDWDAAPPPPEYFTELFRVSKNQIIWGGNYFPLPPARCIICWDKMQPWENFSQWEMAWTSYDRPAKLWRISATGGKNDKKIHPTQKPVELYARILQEFAKPGYKILDTHLGSGTHAVALHQKNIYDGHNLTLTASERNQMHYADMIDYIKLKTAQQTLFNE